MPFTFAHPAAALPLARLFGRHASLSALAIGSMMPDLPFFLGVAMTREETHHPLALLTWSLPAGILLYLLFQATLRQALADLMPAAIQARLATHAAPAHASWRSWPAIIVAVLCGGATHLLWDNFTHSGTTIVRALPFLQTKLAAVGSYDLYAYKLAQHASTVLGLALLAAWSRRWFVRTAPQGGHRAALPASARWMLCTLLAIVPPAVGTWAASDEGPQGVIPVFIFTTLPVFFWLLTAFGLARKLTRN